MTLNRNLRGISLIVAALLAGCPSRPLDEARRLEAEGKLDAAAEAYVRVAKTDPSNMAAWDGAVDLYCQKLVRVGDCLSVLDLELDQLGNVNRHTEAYAAILEKRSRARVESGMGRSALGDVERALKVAPNRASLYVARARALLLLGNTPGAKAAIERAKELDPQNAEADALVEKLVDRAPDTPDGFGGPDPAGP